MVKKSTLNNQSSTNTDSLTMEQLLASQPNSRVSLSRNQEIEGEIVSLSGKEIILDLNSKSEGVLLKKELPPEQLLNIKIGQKIKAFVYDPENESGQTILSLHPSQAKTSRLRKGSSSYDNFIQAQRQKKELSGYVVEVNRGGLIVDVGGTNGFLPNSQVGFDLLSKVGKDFSDLIGQQLKLSVIEVDQSNFRLIFSQRTKLSDEIKRKFEEFKSGQNVKGRIVAILPFGLVVDIAGLEGLVFVSDVAWERVEDLASRFKTGEEIEAKVIGVDLELGRVNLSIKQLSEDPFTKVAEDFPADEVVKGEITNNSDLGISIILKDGVEGFLQSSKMDSSTKYEIGKSMNFLVDNVDTQRRRVNLVPFVTSTQGLIYK